MYYLYILTCSISHGPWEPTVDQLNMNKIWIWIWIWIVTGTLIWFGISKWCWLNSPSMASEYIMPLLYHILATHNIGAFMLGISTFRDRPLYVIVSTLQELFWQIGSRGWQVGAFRPPNMAYTTVSSVKRFHSVTRSSCENNATGRPLISNSNMEAICGVIRISAISAMFEGDKHRENSALTDDCARIPDVLKDVYETRKEEVWNGMHE